jgi:hypothetical protein
VADLSIAAQGFIMFKKLLLLCICSALPMLNSGCAFNPFQIKPPVLATQEIKAVIQVAPTELSVEATQALLAAEKKISEARNSLALWISAVEKLTLARQAATVYDSDKTMQLARETVALCELSLAQMKLPLVSW